MKWDEFKKKIFDENPAFRRMEKFTDRMYRLPYIGWIIEWIMIFSLLSMFATAAFKLLRFTHML